MKAARNGSELVRNLLSFSRRQSLKPKACNMKTTLNDFQRVLGRALGESIILEVSTPDERLAAFMDRPQFETALLNLCINSRDAIPANGKINLKTFSASPNLSKYPLSPGSSQNDEDFVCVQVTDNGSGIEPELLGKITEPYFTTKKVGEGSGLGLSSVAGFVDQSGGSMRFFSTPGVGTTVELFLPRSILILTEEKVSAPSPPIDLGPKRNQIKVLVVDDEPDVLRLAVRWLTKSGYEVIQARNGDEALTCIEDRKGDIDVLFSDIVMPGTLDGRSLAEKVSRHYPKIGIQLATGYDQSREERGDRIARRLFPVLFKPYNLRELSESIAGLARRPDDPASPGSVEAGTTATPRPSCLLRSSPTPEPSSTI
jgi:CheY-like chemotaxis protein